MVKSQINIYSLEQTEEIADILKISDDKELSDLIARLNDTAMWCYSCEPSDYGITAPARALKKIESVVSNCTDLYKALDGLKSEELDLIASCIALPEPGDCEGFPGFVAICDGADLCRSSNGAEKTVSEVNRESPSDSGSLVEFYPTLPPQPWRFGEMVARKNIEQLKQTCRALSEAEEEISDSFKSIQLRRKKTKSPAFDEWLRAIATIYEEKTGRVANTRPDEDDKPSGPFIEFAHAAWRPLEVERLQKEQFAERVKSKLSQFKKLDRGTP